MSRVRIVGGGLTGIIAAFQAHRLGCRDIELFEQYGELGGSLAPRTEHGLELRLARYAFGGRNDPVRSLLEWHGVAFDDFEDRRGSVSPGAGGEPVFTEGFAGPALPARQTALVEPAGESLADRLRAYPAEIEQALARHCQWSLGVWLDELHASAAGPLGVAQVYPRSADTSTLSELKHADTLYDGLYGLPVQLGGGAVCAALPRGGFAGLFASAGRALAGLGVKIRLGSMISPREAVAACRPGEAVVWAAGPEPLFKAMNLEIPKPALKSFAVYVFRAEATRPFWLQNFTAKGVVFRLSTYESRGETLLTAECVAEAGDAELRREIRGLMAGFGGVELKETLLATVEPRPVYASMAEARAAAALRGRLARDLGPAFVAGWERADQERISDRLAAALSAESSAAAAA